MPNMVYLLELATILTMRDADTLHDTGEDLTAALQSTVRDAANLHPVIVSRAVYYLLCLLQMAFVSFQSSS